MVGKYEISSVLGSGAMGTIYKAEQSALGKAVVIKVLHRHLLTDPELIQRFHREARAASRLNHPNCVQIMDFGALDDGSLYIAMEYIQGIDLATLLEREYPIDHRRLIAIVKQVCQALDEAHANGVLHRDLKPENIMIEDRRTVRDHVKVVDFGIAKLEENNPGSRRSFQTRTGIVCGTPEYMSPEQARGLKLDARSDLYAIGVMLYHLTTDHLPFEAASPIEVVTKHISEIPKVPSTYRKDIPEALERLIMVLLEKDREKRPASALDVHAELERIDRELAAERRERVESKNNDDATMVDMRPISDLVAAIDIASAKVSTLSEVPTQDDAAAAGKAAKDISEAAIAKTGLDLSMGDTIPDQAGRSIAKRMQAQVKDLQAKKNGELKPVAASAAGKAPSSLAENVRNLQPAPLSRPSREAQSRSSDAAPSLVSREALTAAHPIIAATPRAAPPEARKSRMWLWLTLGGIAAVAGTVVAVILSS